MSIGAFATLALPPVNFLPAVILSGVGLVWCMAFGPEGKWSGFAAGWAFSFGYFVFGLYWVGNALLVFADQHAWMLPFAALGLPAFLALFGGLAGVAISFARGPLATPIAVTAAFGAADWLRGHILTGLPWNLFGHAWSGIDPLLQSASLYGVYGMGIVVLLTATLPGGLVSPVRWQRLVAILIPIVILGTHWAAGAYRLSGVKADADSGLGIRLVQANIPQREKWALRYRARNIAAHLRLSVENRPPWIQHVIWPEMAATLYLERDAKSREVGGGVVPPGGLLVTGAPRRNPEGGAYNAILALDETGRISGHYNKA
ncbi:MAG: apolipoprotein N-acyltransferase, partial [Pseudomonadota bacterium]|nr:apolipoprotein N-acyltransferase [Pseudomonadota bacterium]